MAGPRLQIDLDAIIANWRMVQRRDLDTGLALRLDAAGVPLRPGEWMLVHVGIAILTALVFLLMSMRRWRFSPPAGTNRAHPVPPHQLRHVTGGTRSEP